MLVRVLGRIGAEHADGTRVDPPSGPQRRLLALFAMRAGRAVSSDTIADLFDLSPGAVRTSVSRLRRLLGGDVLTTAAGGYVLTADTDADRFQNAVTTARSLPSHDATPHLIDALATFDGPPLDEFAAEPWAISEATRLKELRAAVVEDLAALRVDEGAFDESIDLLHPHLEQFPYRDRPRELQMRALALSGRQVEALRVFQNYRTTLTEDVGVEPGEALRLLEGQIATGELAAIALATGENARHDREGLTNLDELPNEFVGRSDDAARVAQALTESRLVTLVGPGGVGKTRLGHKVASDRVGLHSDGVWLVELVDAEDGADVLRTLVEALRVPANDTVELADHLSGRDLLVVLDNCEHVASHVSDVVECLLEGTTRLRIIATSRTPIRLVGEQVVHVYPLATADAVALYEARARAVGTEITPDERGVVAEICEQLDCVPLALELAAACSRVFAPRDLHAQLHRRFDLLKGGQRGRIAGRHGSLRAAVDWSYETLSAQSQQLFNRLSVFSGELPLSAIDAVGEGLDANPFDLVAELVDMSLLMCLRGPAGTRYRMLETLRLYGVDRLRDTGLSGDAENRHIDWCVAYCNEQVRAAHGESEALSLDGLVSAAGNLRLAVSRLIERGERDRAIDLVSILADLSYGSNVIADVVRPLTADAVTIDGFDSKVLLAMELVRRSTSGSTISRREIAEPLAAGLEVDDPGAVLVPVLLIATALGCGVPGTMIDEIVDRARAMTDIAERARLLVAAGLARYYGDAVPEDFDAVEEAMQASRRAGMRRLTIASGSMACIAGIRMGRPLDGARLARPVLADLDHLGHPSIMSNGLVMLYTEAAIQADLAPEEHLLGIRRAGPHLKGDFNRLGLTLARIVQYQGDHGLAVRAVGACETTNRSRFSAAQVETVLRLARDCHDERELDSLLAAGAVSEQSDLYREMWSSLESSMFALRA